MPAPIDSLRRLQDTASHPARRAFTVIPHNTEPLAILPKALLIGADGTIALRAVDSAADVWITVSAGQIVPIRASHVRSTGTTASGIVALA